MSTRIPIGRVSVQLAVVRSVSRTFVECQYLSGTGDNIFKCPIPWPYAGQGGGFLAGIEIGSVVLVAIGGATQHFIVGFVPNRRLFFDQEGVEDTPYNINSFPELEEGELMIKSPPSGSYIRLDVNGDIQLDAGLGDSSADLELSSLTKTLFFRTDNVYNFSEAGRVVEGVIKRDRNTKESSNVSGTFDFLGGPEYNKILFDVGRSPGLETQYRTTKISRDFIRNPALVEKRSIVYEYANSFGVQNISSEANAIVGAQNVNGVDNLLVNTSARHNRRTDVLNLNMFNYNHLIEKVEGTLVDIYGNVLDINRHVLKIPNIDLADTGTAKLDDLKNIYRYMRRSVKYHVEINSRKEIEGDEPSRTIFKDYAREHSRWSIDVDGEGLTKINIPASSNTGNIPVLGRYLTSVQSDKNNRDSGSYKDPEVVDIRMAQFGAQDKSGEFLGPEIIDTNYVPTSIEKDSGEKSNYKSIVVAGTAYHDLLSIAPLIFSSEGKLRNPNPQKGAEVVYPVTKELNNKIDDQKTANAGGRSVHANLDGSLEMSIGADKVDGKSLVIDCQGGTITHFGKDKNNRSIIHQSDGDVIVQIGGDGIEDSGFRPGRLEIHLARGPGKKPQKIIIDENGMTLDIEGNTLLSSSGDFTIGAGGRLLLAGEVVYNYGSFDSDVDGTRQLTGTERLTMRNGRPNY